ncbi:hypothetical protein CDAR_236681 [Caerostris darwini]|uniref:Uncharacterized protein n=1 Tax=Caerostris darwini TaxID=1538125 RepID=A0AAV4NIE0_9ARAC|nr:hypothetical protein CDAR_236681 [Caerostris darwini]
MLISSLLTDCLKGRSPITGRLKTVKSSTSTSSVGEDVSAVSQSEKEAEVYEKKKETQESEEQIREHIHKDTKELKENDNFGDSYNEEENKSEDRASVKEKEEDKEINSNILFSDFSGWFFPVPDNLRVD